MALYKITDAFTQHCTLCKVCGANGPGVCNKGMVLMKIFHEELQRKESGVLLELVNYLRQWDAHILACKECAAYDGLKNPQPDSPGPCGIGRAIILNLIRTLERGL